MADGIKSLLLSSTDSDIDPDQPRMPQKADIIPESLVRKERLVVLPCVPGF
jgi:hypothetical protein